MNPRRSTYDVAVVGAGPGGAVAAASFADRGANVLWIEANPRAAERLAGEWLHPPAVRILRSLGLAPDDAGHDAIAGRGFVVFPEDGSDPIRLPYSGSDPAMAFEHASFVRGLRERVRARPGVHYVEGARVLGIDGYALRFAEGEDVMVDRIVGADGKGSAIRRSLAEAPHRGGGRMAGVTLDDVELPFESHGHVFVGGPGPALLYRIDRRRSRLCLDLPESLAATPAALWEAFAKVLPAKLRLAFREALESRPIEWAAIRVTPRRAFGRGHVALIGDAVGTVHPLCAAGMTIAIRDAVAVAEESDVARYTARRRTESDVAELLSDALHRVLVGRDPVTDAIRGAMYRSWRTNDAERSRTMDILAGDILAGPEFGAAFVRVSLDAARSLAGRGTDLRERTHLLLELARWGRYPLDAVRGPAAFAPWSRRRAADERLALTAEEASSFEAPLPRPRPLPLGEDRLPSGESWEFCVDSLEKVSRSFAKPIGMLPPRLRVAVTVGYLVCRIADTVEDAVDVAPEDRDRLYGILLDVLERGAPASRFTRAVRELPATPDEHALAIALDRVLHVLESVPEEMRVVVRRWAAEMTRGMQIYSHRPRGADGFVAPRATPDLERYCYFVAGTVGHMLTDLFVIELGVDRAVATELERNAESFGIGLQLVNILKDVTDDHARGVSFVPRPLLEARGLGLDALVDRSRRADAHAAVVPLFGLARTHLDRALTYVLAIPHEDPRIRLFCLLPLWMAARTLVLAAGNDAMFVPGEPVKIDRDEVDRLARDCLARANDDASLREGYEQLWAEPESGRRARGSRASLQGRAR